MLEEAASDRVDCRDVSKIPNKDAATVLVATGDSITSAHLQMKSSDKTCGHVSQDHRGHPGNNGFFSYVGRYANANKNVVDYYNFARTGYSTGQIIGAGPNDTDACGFPWGRNSSPLSMAEAEVVKAKEAGHHAYFVTTGGINDTNWTDVLRSLAFCRGLEFVADRLSLHVNWANPKGKEGIFTEGGGCVLTLHNPITNKDTNLSATVPRFNGPEVFASIGNNANSIVNTMLDAGADKVVWMLYYDIVPAVTDAGTVAELMIRAQLPDWIANRVPNLGPRLLPLIDPLWIGQAREVMTAINTNIIFNMPLRDHLQVVGAPDLTRLEMQETGVSGSPHPNAIGHDRLAARLAAGFDGL
ncbi:hypothetical protein Afe04nite_61820 [Asanoa ferruginea]|nr:hypothetical protein Afe04nite_61820 [Asanoa ferruginea]